MRCGTPNVRGNMKKALIFAGVVLAAASQATFFNSNESNIAVPGTGTGGTATGSAGAYPITFNVNTGGGIVTDVNIEINWSTEAVGAITGGHSFGDDIDMLLVNPLGTSVLFLSDAGGSSNFLGTYLFDDEAAGPMSDGNPSGLGTNDTVPNGTYQVSSYSVGDVFLAPAPQSGWGAVLSGFDAAAADGVWTLYVMDDAAGDIGTIVSARLDITSEAVPEPMSMIALAGVGAFIARRKRKSA